MYTLKCLVPNKDKFIPVMDLISDCVEYVSEDTFGTPIYNASFHMTGGALPDNSGHVVVLASDQKEWLEAMQSAVEHELVEEPYECDFCSIGENEYFLMEPSSMRSFPNVRQHKPFKQVVPSV